MRHVFLCGPSGGGKTTLAKEFASRYGYVHIESITRQAYKMFGVENQAEANKLSPQHHFELQQYVSQWYVDLTSHLMAYTRQPLIFERSPMDHSAYLYAAELAISPHAMAKRLVPHLPQGHDFATVFVPAPPPEWSISDSFRSPPANELFIQEQMRILYDGQVDRAGGLVLTTTDIQSRVREVARHLCL